MNIINKKARLNYNLFEKYEAGVALTGAEAKTLRTKGADLSNSFVKIIGNEAYLINANIHIPEGILLSSTRTRKLLMHKSEIISIKTKIKAKKLTLVPTKLYNKRYKIKLEIALGKAKRKFEKRQAIKKKDIEREIEQEFKNKYK